MIESLHLDNVGPAPEMAMELAPRLNLITGDNGLGKSFILDVIWWALTRKWPHDLNPNLTSGYPARPTDPKVPATIGFRLTSKVKKGVAYESKYSPRDEAWIGKPGRPWNPGLVIYAHADGGFSVWDPARNYWKSKGDIDVQDRLPGYVFSAKEVWEGLECDVRGKPTIVCNGLIRDWAGWIKENGLSAKRMALALRDLAPAGETMEPGPLIRISVDDARDIPTIKTAYAEAVPILYASAAVRRVLSLAYMLMWTWDEHMSAAALLGEPCATQVVMLFDEVESHLHPRWQRSILNSIFHINQSIHEALSGEARIQLIAATHSPLILASAEPFFDPDQDAWFDLDLGAERRVTLAKQTFVRHGTAGRWLTSPAFDLASEGRSLEAEKAIASGEVFLDRRRQGEPWTAEELDKVDQGLRATLPDVDRFWIRWSSVVDELRTPPG
jgi:hypothetical protein